MEGFQEKRIRGENEFVAISGCMVILVSSKPAMGTKIGGCRHSLARDHSHCSCSVVVIKSSVQLALNFE